MRTASVKGIEVLSELRIQVAFPLKLQCVNVARYRRCAPLLKALCCDEHGGALIESALVLTLYLTLVIAMMNVGIVLFAYANTVYASKVAVRYAAVHSSASPNPCTANDIQNIINPYLWGAPTGGITIAPQWSPSNTVGSTFSVTVLLKFPTSLPFVNSNNFQTSTTAQGFVLY